MSNGNGTPPDPDDFFAETRMSFGDHIEELRTHLWRAIYGFGIAVFISFFFGHLIVAYITAPVKQELERFYERRQKKILAQQNYDKKYQSANRPTPFRKVLVPRSQLEALRLGEDPSVPRPRIVTEQQAKEEEANPTVWSRFARWWEGEESESAEEKGPRYQLTASSLADLQSDGLSKEVLEQLKKLKGRGFETRDDFLNALNPLLSPADNPLPAEDLKALQGKILSRASGAIPENEKDRKLVGLWMSIENPLPFTSDIQPAQRAFLDVENATTLNVQEAFMVWFKVCMVSGIVVGSPWIFWQIWMFVAAGLYPHEKRLVHVYLPVSLFLFLSGVIVCEVFVIPKAIEALLWFNEIMGLKPDFRLNEWLSFAIFMPVVFGASFQTPLVMLFLHRLGIMDIDSFRNRRRMAWFVMAVFAAVITPSTDALSMLFLWVPMSLLFELGIILIKFSPNTPDLGVETPEADEMVEV
jgi:sec-independent protein translocase protein TatC